MTQIHRPTHEPIARRSYFEVCSTLRSVVTALLAALALAPASARATPAVPPPRVLPTEVLVVDTARGPAKFTVEVAADDDTRERGLMFRKSMADAHGMIFDFHKPQQSWFWMENTLIPLDMLFVAADGRILTVARNAVPLSKTAIPSGGPIRAVVEINGGLADKLGIKPGDRVRDAQVFPNG